MRIAALALVLAAGCAAADGASDGRIVSARYEAPNDVYPHRIMGTIVEKRVLAATLDDGRVLRFDLRSGPEPTHVFEDIAPRVADADGDGVPDIVVVQTDPDLGAQLAIYSLRRGALVKAAATPHIGQRFRWLAPVGIADLNGDGVTDIAYVDRPHLAKILRVWSWAPGGLTEIAQLPGVTNHRIGDEVIWGGLRDCGDGPEMILADEAFARVVAIRFADGRLASRPAGQPATAAGFDRALACP
jgi:hypothetical protein